ncbi:unnamed protein product [Leptosia nina]|uniref:Hexosyltransferase n=1 Tax=Leptosia nina TaxID=320188 RepID=A0AAV1JY11_9NEOP
MKERRHQQLCSGHRLSVTKGLLLILILVTSVLCWWNAADKNTAEIVYILNLNHFKNNRNLSSYLQETKLLLEPRIPPCRDKEIPILVTVATIFSHAEQRDAIRKTWATRLPTLFVVGLNGPHELKHLTDKDHDDLIVYEFQEHYQNLTLKTALMLKWTSERCSSVHFLLKTDDDILLNPWQLEKIIEKRPNADLIGYVNKNAGLYRQEHSKWYLPRWLYKNDTVPEYLSGNAYLINGKHLSRILEAAYEVPLINIEDIYITYLVAKRKLGLTLTHEDKLYGFRPWLPVATSYWQLASAHSFTPQEMYRWWSELLYIANTIN